MKWLIRTSYVAVALVFNCSIHASEETNGPDGINSIVTGLDGTGVPIGQVEPGRPGVPDFDTAANCCNSNVVPTAVFVRDMPAAMNDEIYEHGLWVASVMISTQTTVAPPFGQSPPIGVAQEAYLYSSAYADEFTIDRQQDAAVAAQALASTVWATNMSFGIMKDGSFQFDGNSTLTQFVDWSARAHEVLYVVAGNEQSKPPGVPSDNYNGITVAASGRNNGVFREVSILNRYDETADAVGDRTSTDILAPGEIIDVAGANGSQPSRIVSTGTSLAAPHVTGTLALLQQRANVIDTTNAHRHETMKAVIINSADKIKDIIGMERTVVKSNGHGWTHSDPAIPFDREMGVGHLNAKRAVEQFDGGEHPPGPVPPVGWDYFTHIPFGPTRYTVTLNPGDYVSATLVWDRDVELNSASPDYVRGDTFIDHGFTDLNLYLVPAGFGVEQAVARSTSTAWNLEHIFASVQNGGSYEIWVDTNEFNEVPYALAWWAGADERPATGNFNRDSSVDAADYIVWRKDDGTVEGYNDWRANFGNPAPGVGSSASVPEPSAGLLLCVALGLICSTRRVL